MQKSNSNAISQTPKTSPKPSEFTPAPVATPSTQVSPEKEPEVLSPKTPQQLMATPEKNTPKETDIAVPVPMVTSKDEPAKQEPVPIVEEEKPAPVVVTKIEIPPVVDQQKKEVPKQPEPIPVVEKPAVVPVVAEVEIPKQHVENVEEKPATILVPPIVIPKVEEKPAVIATPAVVEVVPKPEIPKQPEPKPQIVPNLNVTNKPDPAPKEIPKQPEVALKPQSTSKPVTIPKVDIPQAVSKPESKPIVAPKSIVAPVPEKLPEKKTESPKIPIKVATNSPELVPKQIKELKAQEKRTGVFNPSPPVQQQPPSPTIEVTKAPKPALQVEQITLSDPFIATPTKVRKASFSLSTKSKNVEVKSEKVVDEVEDARFSELVIKEAKAREVQEASIMVAPTSETVQNCCLWETKTGNNRCNQMFGASMNERNNAMQLLSKLSIVQLASLDDALFVLTCTRQTINFFI